MPNGLELEVYLLSGWKTYDRVPSTERQFFLRQPEHAGIREKIVFIQETKPRPFTFVTRTVSSLGLGDVEAGTTIRELLTVLTRGESFYFAETYIDADKGSKDYPPVHRITQR